MFLVDSEGLAITESYARERMRWETVVEITQIKGDSETHPLLSPGDEFADFETYQYLIDGRADTDKTAPVAVGAYIRPSLMRGLELEQKLGINPFQFGVIGSTDSHSGLSSAEETNFHGKMALDSTPETKDKFEIGKNGGNGWDMSASGLAAVWAKENTREAIFAAFKRREVYASTGPRITLRFFAGWDFTALDANARDFAKTGYRKGVPMGGELSKAPADQAPTFLIQAVKDPKGANLDRIQVVKGYLDASGKAQETIYDVALSDERRLTTKTQTAPVGNTVDTATGQYSNSIGDSQLVTVWQDPDFNPAQRAFYYARVLEIPTPRHTLLDELALQQNHIDTDTIQERAYSSPIWYTP
jgi:hypothetical protein